MREIVKFAKTSAVVAGSLLLLSLLYGVPFFEAVPALLLVVLIGFNILLLFLKINPKYANTLTGTVLFVLSLGAMFLIKLQLASVTPISMGKYILIALIALNLIVYRGSLRIAGN